MSYSQKLSTAYHSLATLLDAGLPIVRSLQSTAPTAADPRLNKAFLKIADAVAAGENLSQSMASYPHLFKKFDLLLIESAELSGNLPHVFQMLSEWYAFTTRIKHKLISGLVLPLGILTAAPILAPFPLLILGRISFFQYLYQLLLAMLPIYLPVLTIAAIIRYSPQTGPQRIFLDNLTLRIPLLGRAVRNLAISRYCRSFYILYKSGIPIIQCTQKAASLTGNYAIGKLFAQGHASVVAGNPVHEGFSKKLPAELLELWAIGEESGSLESVSKKLADNFEYRATMLFEEFARWMPRLVYFLVMAYMASQIFRMASALQSTYYNF